jgi:hypothetical protein
VGAPFQPEEAQGDAPFLERSLVFFSLGEISAPVSFAHMVNLEIFM